MIHYKIPCIKSPIELYRDAIWKRKIWNVNHRHTRSSATADGPRDALCQSKSCHRYIWRLEMLSENKILNVNHKHKNRKSKSNNTHIWRTARNFVCISLCTTPFSALTLLVGAVICLERGANLHMAQMMPLPLTVSCFSKIQIGFTFLVPAYLGSPGKRAVKRVYVCM